MKIARICGEDVLNRMRNEARKDPRCTKSYGNSHPASTNRMRNCAKSASGQLGNEN